MIKKFFPFIIITLLHVAGFLYVTQTLNIYLKDSFEYLNLAKNLVSDFTIYSGDLNMPFYERLVSLRPPVYGAFIALSKFFSSNNLVVVFFQGLLSLFTIILLIKTINHLFKANYNYFVVAAFLFFPSQIVYANMIMSEILFQFFVLLFVYLHVLYYEKKSIKYLIYACFSLCLMLLTKPVSLFILISYTLFVSIQVFKRRFNFGMLIFPAVAFICLLSYQYYNFQKTGYFHYSSLTSTYLLNYQLLPVLSAHENAYRDESPQTNIDFINEQAEKETTFKSYSQKRISLTLKELKKRPGVYARLTVIGMFQFFIDTGWWDVSAFLLSNHSTHNLALTLYMWFVLFFKLIVLALLLYAITILKNQPVIYLLILFIIVSVALATGITGSARFQLPVYPLVLILCALSLESPKIKQFTDKFKLQPRF